MNKRASILFLLFVSVSVSTAQDVDNGRIAYYNFSNDAEDRVGSLDGTIHGATLVPDRFGNNNSAFSFDGVNDYISVPHDTKFNFEADDEFSISMWVKLPENQGNIQGNNNEILGKWDAFNDEGYPFAIRFWNQTADEDTRNRLFTVKYDSENCGHAPRNQSPCPLNADTWYHIVYQKKGNDLVVYQNGKEVDRVFDNTSLSCNTINSEPIFIGKRQANQRHFKGEIDDISFYNRAISIEEINILLRENNWSPPESNEGTEIFSFSFPEQIAPAKINSSTNTIDITVTCDTDISNLIAEFTTSEGALIKVNNTTQESGVTSNDFTATLTYEVTSENLCNSSNWKVNVERQTFNDQEVDKLTEFSSFKVAKQIKPERIDIDNHEIKLYVGCGTDINSLIPVFEIPEGATAYINGELQKSGESVVDFNDKVTYDIIAQNGCIEQSWIVSVNQVNGTKSFFEEFSITGQIEPAEIDIDSIKIKTYCDTKLEQVQPEFKLNNLATAFVENVKQESGSSRVNLSKPLLYNIESLDGCMNSVYVIAEKTNIPKDSLFVPNILTPNGDFMNDYWKFNPKKENLSVEIYNRWGNKVFYNNNYLNNWTAEEVPSGVYYYSIDDSQCSLTYKGWLKVIK